MFSELEFPRVCRFGEELHIHARRGVGMGPHSGCELIAISTSIWLCPDRSMQGHMIGDISNNDNDINKGTADHLLLGTFRNPGHLRHEHLGA